MSALGIFQAQAQDSKALTINSITTETSASAMMADSNNRISGLTYTISITNSGDTKLTPGDENYSLTLYDSNKNLNMHTVPVDVELEAGASTNVTVSWDFSLDPVIAASGTTTSTNFYLNLNVKENVSGTSASAPNPKTFYPYWERFLVCDTDRPYELNNKTYAFGFRTKPAEKELRVYSQGGAPVEVVAIDVPEGFSIDCEFPFTLEATDNTGAPERFHSFKLKFNPVAGGACSGDMVVRTATGAEMKYTVSGAMPIAGKYLETFECGKGKLPQGWIIGENAAVDATVNSAKNETNQFALYMSKNNGTAADPSNGAALSCSPKLHFDEGETLYVDVNAGTYSTPYVGIAWSPDRANWTMLKRVFWPGNGVEGEAEFDSNTYNMKGMVIDGIPAGDGYIGFFMNYSRIDNVMGGTLVPVNYDLYAASANGPSKGTVNHSLDYTMTVKTLGGDAMAEEYTAALYGAVVPVAAEGEEAPAAPEYKKLADVPSQDILVGSVTIPLFKASFMPHEAGNWQCYFELTLSDGTKMLSPVMTTAVENESLSGLVAAVTPVSGNDTRVPLYMNYNNSQSHTLYTADELAKAGLSKGAKIVGAVYKGYAASDKAFTGDGISVGIQNSELTVLTPSQPVEFTEFQGHQAEYNNVRNGNAFYDYIDVNFAEPFVYDGNSLLMAVKSENQKGYVNIYFEKGAGVKNTCIYKNNDNFSRYESASFSTYDSAKPVVYFKIENDPYYLSGNVTYNEEPVAGAQVRVDAEGVQYYATTDEAGHYNMMVIQSSENYTLEVMAEGHPRYTHDSLLHLGEANVEQDVALREWPVLSGTVMNAIDRGVESAKVSLTYGDNVQTFQTDENGEYSGTLNFIDAPEFDLTIDHPDYRIHKAKISLYNGKDRSYSAVLENFTYNREYPVTIKVTDVRGTSLEGQAVTVKSEQFRVTYDAAETTLDANGQVTFNAFGGKHTLTVQQPGMATITAEFNVNKPVELEFTLNEDVNIPQNVVAAVEHNAFTGKNDVRLSWYPDLEEQAPRRAVHRSAANPAEQFVISLDGQEIGTTADYEYLIENVAEGKHTFNVYAKYAVQQSESVDVPMEINPADYVAATYNVKTNNQESADGFTIKVTGRNADYAVVVENGKAEIPYLPLGKYDISMQAPFYAPYSQTVDYTAAQTLDIELAETITAPFNLEVEAIENEDLLGFTVDMKWNRDNGFADSFENYDDFATGQFGGWATKDLNTAPSYAISLGNQDVTFPGASTTASPVAVAPMVFNPAATEPSMENDANIAAADGSKSVIFISPMNKTADKWLISPQIKVGNEYAWTLKAKAYTFYPETIELCLSTTGAEPADFQVIETIKPGYQAWQDYTVDLSAYKDQKVYLGLHYVSDNSFICMVDAFKVANKDGNDAVEVGKVLSYDILLDDELKGNTEQTAFTLTDVQGGEHVVGVKANYTSGASEVTTYPLSLVSGVDGLDAASATGDVITPAGIVVMRNATLKQVRSLTPGIYLFRGHKVVVK